MLSSELFGYSSEARVLIINADDFGMYPSGQYRCAAVDRVHLTLVCDFARSRWQSSAAAQKVPSLLDRNGGLFSSDAKAQLLAQARLLRLTWNSGPKSKPSWPLG